MRLRAVDLDLGEDRERDAVGGVADVAMSASVPGSWWPNWSQGNASHGEALGRELLVESLQPGILRGEAAFGGHVDDEQRLAPVFREAAFLAGVEPGAEIVDVMAASLWSPGGGAPVPGFSVLAFPQGMGKCKGQGLCP